MEIQRKLSEQKKWVFKNNDMPVQLRVISAIEINPVEHLHKTMYEYFYVLQGKMTIMVEDQEFQLIQDDVMYAAPGERHKIRRMSEDLILLLLMPPHVPNDKVVF